MIDFYHLTDYMVHGWLSCLVPVLLPCKRTLCSFIHITAGRLIAVMMPVGEAYQQFEL